MTLRLAGRNISPVSAMRSVRPAIDGQPRAKRNEEKEDARGDEREPHHPHGAEPVRQTARDRRDRERAGPEEREDDARGVGREAPSLVR